MTLQAPPMFPDKHAADIKLLNSVASVHYLFGRYAKAMHILGLSLWVDPDNHCTLELFALISVRYNRPAQALRAIERIETTGGDISETLETCRRMARASTRGSGEVEAALLQIMGQRGH